MYHKKNPYLNEVFVDERGDGEERDLEGRETQMFWRAENEKVGNKEAATRIVVFIVFLYTSQKAVWWFSE